MHLDAIAIVTYLPRSFGISLTFYSVALLEALEPNQQPSLFLFLFLKSRRQITTKSM